MERGQTVNQTLLQAPGVHLEPRLGAGCDQRPPRRDARTSSPPTDGATADAFDPVRNNLADGFKPGGQALEPFVQQRPSVEKTLAALPPTLSTARSDLPQVNALLRPGRRPGEGGGADAGSRAAARCTRRRPCCSPPHGPA